MTRRRVWRIVALIVFILVVGIGISAFVPLSEYAITPGNALNVQGLIGVPRTALHQHKGSVLLTDVNLIPLRALDYLYYALDHDAQIVPSVKLTGPLSAADYNEQGVIDMVVAREAATYVALRKLGYPVQALPSSIVVYELEPTSPAKGRLGIGDVISAVAAKPTPSLQSLLAVLSVLRPGTLVTVSHHPLSSARSSTSKVALGVLATPAPGQSPICMVSKGKPGANARACLGVFLEQLVTVKGEPFRVSIDADGIVGPSAGLAFTLGLIERIDRFDLTGGKKIAATGTMSLNGDVGDVGGVAQKTVAVRNAGATVFLVPTVEVPVARAHAGSKLKVIGVANISGAISALEHLGGRLSRP